MPTAIQEKATSLRTRNSGKIVSAEEADEGVAEFWTGGELFGATHFEDGELDRKSTRLNSSHRP